MKLKSILMLAAMFAAGSSWAQDLTIANEADWKAFIGNTSANAKANVKLTGDFTINDYFRGTFSGTIDGQGHTITLPENLTQDFAPIGTAGAGAKFKNLNIVGDVTTNKQLSGIAWKVAGATTIENVNVNLKVNSTSILTGGYIVNCEGKTTFKNCHSTVDLYVPGNIEANFSAFICKVNTNGSFRFENCSTDGQIFVDGGWRAGGFVASDNYDVGEATFINCISNCDILQKNTAERAGGFVGTPHWNNNETKRSYVFTNCLQTGKVKHLENGNMVNNPRLIIGCQWISPKCTTTNCYYTTGTEFPVGTNALQFARTDDSALASGALCYALNGDQSQINFYQTLGEDAAPVLDSTHKQVFASGRKHCDGSDYADLTYNNVSGETTQDEHNYVDNVCNYCGDLVIAADGYFHVVSPTSWAGFAAKLSKGITNINVKLDTDLTITQMLASNYCGTFDGQGHTLNINIGAATGKNSIFNTIGAATVKNLIVTGQVTGESNTAPIACYANGNVTLENVITNVAVTQTTLNDGNCSGMIGCANANLTFRNCIVAGLVNAKKDAGGFVGWGASRTFTMDNCAMIGDVTTEQGSKSIFLRVQANSNTYNITNTYYKPCTPTIQCGNGSEMAAKAKTIAAEDIASGALTYKLNGDQSKINFYQTLDEDNIPTINTTHKQVYAEGKKHCDGNLYSDITFNNVAENITKDDHDYDDNVCTYCGDLVLEDGYFHITNPARWTAFYNKQRAGITNINVKLDTDLTVSDPLRNKYEAIFDGQGHTITAAINLPTWDNVGIFQFTGNATIKNLRVDGSVVGNNNTAAYVGQAQGKTKFENVVCSAQVTGGNNVAGFAGSCSAGPQTWTNCLWDGKVTTKTDGGGGYVGWSSDNTMTARNCVAVGEVEGKQIAYMFRVKCTGTVGNAGAAGCIIDAQNLYVQKRGCIDQEVNAEAIANGTPLWWGAFLLDETIIVTAEDMASGKICYDLKAPVWRQTIGDDAYPSMHNNHGIVSKMTSAGYATLYNEETAGTLSENVKVYTGAVNGEWLTMTQQQNTIPAATAVVLKGAEGYYSFTPAADAPAINGENDLKGSSTDVAAEGKYILAKPEGEEVGFYQATGTIAAGKAYLEAAAGAKGFRFSFGDEEDGIQNVNENENENHLIFNLAGQRIQKAQKGISIVGGKKVLK